uniref:Putative microtubule-associated protein futsch-like isoform x4 n=1 Tax=Amblyomma aureolatum TaxID=187763 RepID=A0A1E1XGI5_9ACAR
MALSKQVTNGQVHRMAEVIMKEAREFTANECVRNVDEGIMAALLAKMGFDQDEALWAAKKEKSIGCALRYLRTTSFDECTLCMSRCPEYDLGRNKLRPCQHAACTGCLRRHFWTGAEKGELSCFTCKATIEQHENVSLLKSILGGEYDNFDTKLLNRSLERQSEHAYCVNQKCNGRFNVPRNLRRQVCPYCRTIACAECKSKWRKEHEGRSCEEFKKWKAENDPDDPEFKSQALIRKTAMACPRCKTQYFKAKGGCAHFTCGNCKMEFCECCKTEFWRGEACGRAACKNKGMHGHHPRNCFFYTRDYKQEDLIGLLRNASVVFDEEIPGDPTLACSVNVTNDEFLDSPCGKQVLKAGKCEHHYKEYLCDSIFVNRVDVLSLMSERMLEEELRKNDKIVPSISAASPEDKLTALQQAVAAALPLA